MDNTSRTDADGYSRDRPLTLRSEQSGRDRRWLGAYVDDSGDLHIDGQDLGPSTSSVSGDGEYEWFTTIAAEHVAQLVDVLGGPSGVDVVVLLREWTDQRSYELEKIVSSGVVPFVRSVW